MDGLDGKYGFVVLPISKTADTELVCQILWLLAPANHQVVSYILQNLINYHKLPLRQIILEDAYQKKNRYFNYKMIEFIR